MKKVFLIRHGLPDFPDGKRMCLGTTDLPLGPEGFLQAKAMAQTLPEVTAVFSSPLIRAVQSAEAIGQPVAVLPGLRELYAGEWDGLTFDEIKVRFPELYAARGTVRNLPLPGAEDHGEGLIRFRRAMEEAARQAPGDFAVVAHGGVIGEFLKDITGQWRKPGYTEVIPLVWENGQFRVTEEEIYA